MRAMTLATALVLLAGAPLSARQGATSRDRHVGTAAIAAASRSPLRFQGALMADGVPVGLHVRASRWRDLRTEWLAVPRKEPRVPSGRSLGEAADLFVAGHPGWTVEITLRGVVIRDQGLMSRQDDIDDFSLLDVEIHAAFGAAERAVNPTLPATGGIVGSIISNPDDPSTGGPPDPVYVTVHVMQATLEDMLNGIVAQSPGTGWVLVRHDAAGGNYDTLSVRYPAGLHSDSSNPLPLPARR